MSDKTPDAEALNDVEYMIDLLTSQKGCAMVNITQYSGGLVDVMASLDNGVVVFTERYTHDRIAPALQDIYSQINELEHDAEKLRAAMDAAQGKWRER